ncbi:MAG: hypothetical protein JNK60_22840 [Acidobacteria bacterium]|nr:hypothetical protein [Acidobacteriota bacterium]
MSLRAAGLPLLLSGLALGANTGDLARVAVHGNPVDAQKARAELRAMGPSGLEALFATKADAARLAAAPKDAALTVAAAIDAVARQKDASFSRLYWYTSLDEARAAATATGRPILSLRLLGDLGEDLSCANSRFFRTALYANAEVSEALREGFVLHWESVRPVPRITIDYGDGRRIERTITGNSLHYVLTSRAEVVDVLPGVYGPDAFLSEIRLAAAIAKSLPAGAKERSAALRRHHVDRLAAGTGALVPARLDERSKALMRLKTRGVYEGDSFGKAVEAFEAVMTEDMTHNETVLRPTLHRWLTRVDAGPSNLAAFTDRIYDEVFLTPRRDPWMGLVPPLVYAALDGEGRRAGNAPSDQALLQVGPLPSAMAAGALALSKIGGERAALSSLVRPGPKVAALPPATGIPGAVPTTISPRSR